MGLQAADQTKRAGSLIDDLLDPVKALEARVAQLEANEGLSFRYAILEDQKTAGTEGGTATAGSWYTRTLNTEVYDASNIVTLAANQFTLQTGTYAVFATIPAYNVGYHRARLRNITASTTTALSTTEYSPSTSAQTTAFIEFVFTITSSTVFEIQQRVTNTSLTYGQGVSFGSFLDGVEIYTRVKIIKLR